MFAARDQQRIDQAVARERLPARALELGVQKTEIEGGVMDDERRIGEKGDEIVCRLGKKNLVLEKVLAQAMNGEGFRRHAAFRIEIAMERLARRDAVDELDAADLDQAVAVERIEACGFRVEHDFAHKFQTVRQKRPLHESRARLGIVAIRRKMSRTWARA